MRFQSLGKDTMMIIKEARSLSSDSETEVVMGHIPYFICGVSDLN